MNVKVTEDRGRETGPTFGCTGLGRLYASGSGVAKNDSIAATLFMRACRNDDAAGCLLFGIAVENGVGLPPNLQRASNNYRVACDARLGEGCYRLALLYEKGIGYYGRNGGPAEMRRLGCRYGYAPACVPKATS
jgi:TPR repeat protein